MNLVPFDPFGSEPVRVFVLYGWNHASMCIGLHLADAIRSAPANWTEADRLHVLNEVTSKSFYRRVIESTNVALSDQSRSDFENGVQSAINTFHENAVRRSK